jgi:hypothetical protein
MTVTKAWLCCLQLMQYHGSMPNSLESLSRTPQPKPPEPVAKTVLYGVWDVTKKAVESQSPRAWDERIIHKIKKIFPTLSPEWQQFIVRHHKGIEQGAMIAGVTISTAEFYIPLVIADIISRKRFLARREKVLQTVFTKNEWWKTIKDRYDSSFASNAAGFMVLFGTLNTMIHHMDEEQTPPKKYFIWKKRPSTHIVRDLAKPNDTHEALKTLRDVFVQSYVEQAHRDHPNQKIPFEQVRQQAYDSFKQWKALQFCGLEGLVQFANVQNKDARIVYRRLQGVRRDEYAIPNPRRVRKPDIVETFVPNEFGSPIQGIQIEVADSNRGVLRDLREGKKRRRSKHIFPRQSVPKNQI